MSAVAQEVPEALKFLEVVNKRDILRESFIDFFPSLSLLLTPYFFCFSESDGIGLTERSELLLEKL